MEKNIFEFFYKTLVQASKRNINIKDLLLFTGIQQHWKDIIKNLTEEISSENITIKKIEKSILFIKIKDTQLKFMYSMQKNKIKQLCNQALGTIDIIQLAKSIGLSEEDVPNDIFSIQDIQFL